MSDSEEDYSSEEDEDYVPSEEDSDEEHIKGDGGDADGDNKKKGKKKDKDVRKRKGGIQLDDEDAEIAQNAEKEQAEEEARKKELAKEIEKEQEEKKEEEEKKKADDLWASFLKDVTPPAKPKPKTSIQSTTPQPSTKQANKSGESGSSAKEKCGETSKAPSKLTVTKVFDFAGEEVKITEQVDADSKEGKAYIKQKETESESQKETDKGQSSGTSKPNIVSRLGAAGVPGLKRPGGGLSGVLGKINKKPKMSTLEKSNLDWKQFKQEEGIEDELTQHNKGKQGYLERQAFLERADVRQYEMERSMRFSGNRGKR